MKLDDFIDALHDHGWRQNSDAQHTEIKKLWKKLFPITSGELSDLDPEIQIQKYIDSQPPI